ncbi:hypothetical protein EYF80_055780 [Liparis tanakae]|uniref:Secreted protein n=1 Tax=Liparis tanakae TaxID=230148 RepID=A0A4Z2F0P4_9TELE|nr:hypothetical protein EYF80_055780 [Liparis tanakae]
MLPFPLFGLTLLRQVGSARPVTPWWFSSRPSQRVSCWREATDRERYADYAFPCPRCSGLNFTQRVSDLPARAASPAVTSESPRADALLGVYPR